MIKKLTSIFFYQRIVFGPTTILSGITIGAIITAFSYWLDSFELLNNIFRANEITATVISSGPILFLVLLLALEVLIWFVSIICNKLNWGYKWIKPIHLQLEYWQIQTLVVTPIMFGSLIMVAFIGYRIENFDYMKLAGVTTTLILIYIVFILSLKLLIKQFPKF